MEKEEFKKDLMIAIAELIDSAVILEQLGIENYVNQIMEIASSLKKGFDIIEENDYEFKSIDFEETKKKIENINISLDDI